MKATTLLAVFLFFSAVLAASMHDPEDDPVIRPIFKVGKAGEVAFNTDLTFGPNMLRKGRFVMQHRTEGGQHWISFAPVPTKGSAAEASKPIELQTKISPTKDKITKTEILARRGKDHVEIVRITIAGENVEHLF